MNSRAKRGSTQKIDPLTPEMAASLLRRMAYRRAAAAIWPHFLRHGHVPVPFTITWYERCPAR